MEENKKIKEIKTKQQGQQGQVQGDGDPEGVPGAGERGGGSGEKGRGVGEREAVSGAVDLGAELLPLFTSMWDIAYIYIYIYTFIHNVLARGGAGGTFRCVANVLLMCC